MSYYSVKTVVKLKNNEKLSFSYGYDNEIQPELNTDLPFFRCNTIPEIINEISDTFIDDCDFNLEEVIESFGYGDDYEAFKKKLNKYQPSDIATITLAVIASDYPTDNVALHWVKYDFGTRKMQSNTEKVEYTRSSSEYSDMRDKLVEEYVN